MVQMCERLLCLQEYTVEVSRKTKDCVTYECWSIHHELSPTFTCLDIWPSMKSSIVDGCPTLQGPWCRYQHSGIPCLKHFTVKLEKVRKNSWEVPKKSVRWESKLAADLLGRSLPSAFSNHSACGMDNMMNIHCHEWETQCNCLQKSEEDKHPQTLCSQWDRILLAKSLWDMLDRGDWLQLPQVFNLRNQSLHELKGKVTCEYHWDDRSCLQCCCLCTTMCRRPCQRPAQRSLDKVGTHR